MTDSHDGAEKSATPGFATGKQMHERIAVNRPPAQDHLAWAIPQKPTPLINRHRSYETADVEIVALRGNSAI